MHWSATCTFIIHHLQHRYRSKQTKKIKELEAIVHGQDTHGETAPKYCAQCEKYLCECPAADMLEEPSSAQPGNVSEEPAIVKRGRAGTVELLPLSSAQRTC